MISLTKIHCRSTFTISWYVLRFTTRRYRLTPDMPPAQFQTAMTLSATLSVLPDSEVHLIFEL
jgi:hypothetical protein